jgi:hypothetical protein
MINLNEKNQIVQIKIISMVVLIFHMCIVVHQYYGSKLEI